MHSHSRTNHLATVTSISFALFVFDFYAQVKRIYIPLPDANARRVLLKHKLKGQAFSLPGKCLNLSHQRWIHILIFYTVYHSCKTDRDVERLVAETDGKEKLAIVSLFSPE